MRTWLQCVTSQNRFRGSHDRFLRWSHRLATWLCHRSSRSTSRCRTRCTDSAFVTVKVYKVLPSVFVPTGFTPNNDGRNDVISSYDAHGYGFGWFEQKADGTFAEHKLMGATVEESPVGVKFSQLHALQLADMNGDGVMDLVTGKRRWAHGPLKDDEPNAAPVLYWFEIKRDGKGGAEFIPHLIDEASGVGTRVTPGDDESLVYWVAVY